ncbi:uncharacterized protein [Montipora capricornis]|uniref:uncharacterized protein n=1 Tax=Montipora capricornis TaxID=246305 RepID=UPI0035F124A3
MYGIVGTCVPESFVFSSKDPTCYDAALTSHSDEGFQHLVDKLSHACKEFGLTISLRKTNILAQGAESSPVITIDNTELEVVDTFTYLGPTVSSSTSLDAEISCRIAKAAAVMAKLNKRRVVVDLCQTRAATQQIPPPLPSAPAAHQVAGQSHQHRGPGARCLTEHAITAHSVTPSMAIGHAHRMERDRLPREILYGKLREGVRGVGRPLLRYKDVIKRDLRSALIDSSAWEDIANHQDTWRQSVKMGVSKAEANAVVQATCKRAARKERTASARNSTRHVCATCNLRDCHSGQDPPNPQR